MSQFLRTLLAAVWMGAFFCPLETLAAPPSEDLFPDSTKAYFTVPNAPELVKNWQKTQLGRLLEDPQMKPFGDDLRRQLTEKWSQSHARLGLTIQDLEGLATGELSVALAHPPEHKASLAVLVDVSGNEDKATETLEKAVAAAIKQKATRKKKDVAGITLTIVESVIKGERKEVRRAVYFLHDGLLAASDDLLVAEGIAERVASKSRSHALSKLPAYLAVMERCQSAAGGLTPDARWFVDPVGLADALTTWRDQRRRGGIDYLKIAKNQGFGAVQGAGGYLNFAVKDYGILHRTCVYAPKPYTLAMRMLVFPNGDGFEPQDWVSSEIATYTSFQADLLNAFDMVETLFDEIYGQEGVFQDTIQSIKDDPNGAYDLRKDIVANLGQRLTIVTDYSLPITPTSQRRLLAIETVNEAGLRKIIARAMQNDDRVKKLKIGKHDVWEILDEENAALDGVALNGPGAVPTIDLRNPGDEDAGEQPVAQAGAKPNSAVAVANGHLFVASHLALLHKVLGESEPGQSLAADKDYRSIAAEFAKLGAKKVSAQGFARNDQQYRSAYELFKHGKLPESDTFLGRFLNIALGEEKEGVTRKPRLDGSKLPDFEVVRRYLGSAGSFATSEENGWFIVGFTVNKETPLATGAALKLMSVTPRIIIQEEEEALLGIPTPP